MKHYIGIDLGTSNSAIASFDGTVIAVSHDRYFINKLATRILDFGAEKEHRLFGYEGSYNDYIAYKKSHLSATSESATAPVITASKEQYLTAKRDLAEQRKQERKLKKAKEDIVFLEQRIEELNAEIGSDDIGFDYVKLTALTEELEASEAKLLELYELVDDMEGL